MKKFILAAAAVAAFGLGGVAQADVIDSVGNTISRIFGIPYSPTASGVMPGQVYTDGYGRQYQVDQWGRTVYLSSNTAPVYVYPNGQAYAVAPSYDRDGDGIANQYDRFPNDSRYR